MTQPTPTAAPTAEVPRYVKDAVRAAGGTWKDIDDEQRARVDRHLAATKDSTIQDGHAGLRGKALGTWILDAAGLDAQIEQGRTAAALAPADGGGGDGVKPGTKPAAGGSPKAKPQRTRSTYPDEIHDAVKRAKAIRGYGPGPKQHQAIREAITGPNGVLRSKQADEKLEAMLTESGAREEWDGKAMTPAVIKKLTGVKAVGDLHAMGAKEKPLSTEIKLLGKAMGDDAWCKGGHLAAALAAWVDQLNAAKRS